MTDTIAIDFVAGTHGHFLETTLNKFFNITPNTPETFTSTGTSHKKSTDYRNTRLFRSEHWFEIYADQLTNFKKIISIRFSQEDLLLVSSVSLLRAADLNIANEDLEIDTVKKLKNQFYQSTLEQIYTAYPFLDQTHASIPRYVLREFYKFGFKNPDSNGYWLKKQSMVYPDHSDVCYFDFSSFYNVDQFVLNIKNVEKFIEKKFEFSSEFYQHHDKFLSFIPYQNHKQQCDRIINSVKSNSDINIPKLTLFQESYINGCLENIYRKEMPFRQDRYFTSTKDMLYYITNLAPNL
jgi:hypothetical protein